MDTEAVPLRPSADELLDALGHAVIATDMQGTVLSWNGAAEQLYGWPAAEALGRDITEVTVPELSRQAAAEIMTALREGRSWSGGFPVRNRSGEVLHALVTDSGVYRDGDADRHRRRLPQPRRRRPTPDGALHRRCGPGRRAPCRQLRQPSGREPLRLACRRGHRHALADRIHPEDHEAFEELLVADPARAERVGELRVRTDGTWSWVEVAVTDLYAQPGPQGQVCNIRRSERLARLEERERILEAVHSEVLQDLFAAGLELDRALAHAAPSSAARILPLATPWGEPWNPPRGRQAVVTSLCQRPVVAGR